MRLANLGRTKGALQVLVARVPVAALIIRHQKDPGETPTNRRGLDKPGASHGTTLQGGRLPPVALGGNSVFAVIEAWTLAVRVSVAL